MDSDDFLSGLAEGLGRAIEAALKALLALLLFALTIVFRALQAAFVLARPALYLVCAAAAGYTSILLFVAVLAHYGDDVPASLLALSAIVIVPASLTVLAQAGYGVLAVLALTSALEWLASLAIERSPPVVLALSPAIALVALIFHHATRQDAGTPLDVPASPEMKGHNDEQTTNGIGSSPVAGDDLADHLHRDQDSTFDNDDAAK